MAAYTTQARQKKKIGTKEAVGKINNNQRKLKKGARRGTRRRRRHGRIAEVWPEVQNNLCGRHSPHTPPRGSKGPAATVSNPLFFSASPHREQEASIGDEFHYDPAKQAPTGVHRSAGRRDQQASLRPTRRCQLAEQRYSEEREREAAFNCRDCRFPHAALKRSHDAGAKRERFRVQRTHVF